MSSLVTWALGFTKLGKIVTPIQQFLSGKKVYLSAAAIGVPALVAMIEQFSNQGLGYLAVMTHTPEFKNLMEAIAAMGLRAAITKAVNPAQDPNGPAA